MSMNLSVNPEISGVQMCTPLAPELILERVYSSLIPPDAIGSTAEQPNDMKRFMISMFILTTAFVLGVGAAGPPRVTKPMEAKRSPKDSTPFYPPVYGKAPCAAGCCQTVDGLPTGTIAPPPC
ncbi:hypothetical protein PCANC_25401 [Puccinia coronata f. sp. avenae]|uniref:Uncharacterized protein n=2 Tax=Puccinia coronata f. sp. avenae TaxID=200324 RepID=A0A2N5TKZ6_9BASI|nr:hypothetical protein PCANC_25401 [Puccinia coronata f. sp. avenae]